MRLYYSPFSPCWLLLTDLKICTSLIEQRPDFPIGHPLDRIDFLICSKTSDRSLCISLRLMMQIIAVEFRSEIKSRWSCVVTRLGSKSDRIWNMLPKVKQILVLYHYVHATGTVIAVSKYNHSTSTFNKF